MNKHVKIPAARKVDAIAHAPRSPSTAGHNWFMWGCCVLMVAGFGLTVAASSSLGIRQVLLASLPLGACLAMHFVMHRFLGRSCHGKDGKSETEHR